MTEFILFNLFLGIAFVLAPLMTNHFFLNNSKIYSLVHKIALIVLLIGAVLNLNYTSIVWPLFCIYGVILYLKNEYKFVFSLQGIPTSIPFIFSLISATWFFAGVNNLHLLGYNQAWSFYAALHGSFLGWIFVGCLAFLSQRSNSNKFYLWGCYLSLVLFLCVAFGIDGIPYIKRVGLIGFTLLVPLMIGLYAVNLKNKNHRSRFLLAVSLISIVLSMTLAVLNEFWATGPRIAFGIPIMVFTHGFLNAVITIPCFFLAIRVDCSQKLSKNDF